MSFPIAPKETLHSLGFVLSFELLERTFLMREVGTTHLIWWKCFV
jgi:hypothetical protein